MKIKLSEVIGLTAAPDGRWFANLKNFQQYEISKKEYEYLQTELERLKHEAQSA
jgi:hypothetical protein